jgi:hypothetical protein
MPTDPCYVAFFLHANLQYAEIPPAAIPAVVEHCYRPACAIFLAHPWAKAVFEFSGYTLQVLAADYPDVIDAVRTLVGRGQVELCASTYANPILPLIPRDHARRHITLYQEIHAELFGDLAPQPGGFFPQEFALDAALVPLIRRAGYRWVPIFANHYVDSLTGRMNIVPDPTPAWSVATLRRETAADLMHPFQIQGAQDSTLTGLLVNPALIELLFQYAAGRRSLEEVGSVLATLHTRYVAPGPTFTLIGPSDMEFVGTAFPPVVPGWTWTPQLSPAVLGALLDHLRTLPFVQFATPEEYLAQHPAARPAVYLKCGSDHPLLTPWTDDPDNARLNALCREAAEHLRLAEYRIGQAGGPGADPALAALLADAWRAMLLAENSDGRGWQPVPARRLFCYDQALRAIELAEQLLSRAGT